MAATERGGGPAVAAASGTGPPSVTLNGTRQPQTGDWLVIKHGNDYYTLANMTAPLVGGSTTGVVEITGTGLPADGGTNFAHLRAWKKKITSGGVDLTVTAVESGLADEEIVLAVHVLVGADATDCVEVAAGNFNSTGSTSHVAPSVSPTSADAYLICHSNDGNGANGSPFTSPSSPFVEQYDSSVGGAMGYVGGVEQLSASGATGTRTFTGGNTTYAACSIAIKAASGGTVNGTLAVAGAGTFAEKATQLAPEALAGAGTFVPKATQAAPESMAGAGTFSPRATIVATMNMAAASTLTQNVVQRAGLSMQGAGAYAELATQAAPLALAGAGALSLNSGSNVPGVLGLAGAGTFAPKAVQGAVLGLQGAGQITALSLQSAQLALGGAGTAVFRGSVIGPIPDTLSWSHRIEQGMPLWGVTQGGEVWQVEQGLPVWQVSQG